MVFILPYGISAQKRVILLNIANNGLHRLAMTDGMEKIVENITSIKERMSTMAKRGLTNTLDSMLMRGMF